MRTKGARSISCLLSLALVAALSLASSAEERADVVAEFDVRPRGDLLTVPIAIGGRLYPFVVDTGATLGMFDTSLRPLLGGQVADMVVKTAQGPARVQRFVAPAFSFGPFRSAPGAQAACAEFRDDIAVLGHDVYGIIGTDFLRDKVFRIDFGHGKLQFLTRADGSAGQRFQITWKEGAPFLLLPVPGAGIEEFVIDTGQCSFGSGTLRQPVFDHLLATGGLKLIANVNPDSYSPAAERSSKTRLGAVDRFDVGPFRHEGLIFKRSFLNALGLGYLSRHVVTFDMPHSAIYLRPGREHTRRDRYNLGGADIWRFEGKVLACDPEPGGPVDLAGIRDLDEILEVDGVAVTSTSVFELQRMFATPGRRTVKFKRFLGDGLERETTVVIADADGIAGLLTERGAGEITLKILSADKKLSKRPESQGH